MIAIATFGNGSIGHAAADADRAVEKIPTETPTKHVIIIVGENRSLDHLFGTYEPARKHERVLNLLSEGIINSNGTAGPNFAKAQQFKIVAPPIHLEVLLFDVRFWPSFRSSCCSGTRTNGPNAKDRARTESIYSNRSAR
jgi:hypothetical protein